MAIFHVVEVCVCVVLRVKCEGIGRTKIEIKGMKDGVCLHDVERLHRGKGGTGREMKCGNGGEKER